MTTTPAKVKTVSTPEEPRDAERETLRQVLDSMDGFAELAYEQMFRKHISDMPGTFIGRVGLFLLARRDGASDVDAYKAAMAARISDIKATFPESDEDDEAADLGLEESTRPEA